MKIICIVPLRVRTTAVTSSLSKHYFYVGQVKIHDQKQYKFFLNNNVSVSLKSDIYTVLLVLFLSMGGSKNSLLFLLALFLRGWGVLTFHLWFSGKKYLYFYLYSLSWSTIVHISSCKIHVRFMFLMLKSFY